VKRTPLRARSIKGTEDDERYRGATLRRSTVRTLRADEPDPDGEPRRYPLGPYVRLRWKVAPYTYVERYEKDGHGLLIRTSPRRAHVDIDRAARLYPGRPAGSHAEPTYESEFKRMRPVIRRRSHGQCEVRCSQACQGKATHVHHRKMRSQGGDNSEANLLHVCARCHLTIHDGPAIAYEHGWLVHSWDEPSSVPVTPTQEDR